MVFVGGPRQVGKTTVAKTLLAEHKCTTSAYLNWDIAQHRSALMNEKIPSGEPLIVLDEIHKYAHWRRLVKGFYDQYGASIQMLVTGSARLDYYRKGGDSLMGRYHYRRLHPFSLMEMTSLPTSTDLETLLHFGGFPEPLYKGSDRHWRRWQQERTSRVINEDLRDLETVREISLVELLAQTLPTKVGSPLSVKSLRDALQVAHETAERWLKILENLYYCFRIAPFGAPRIRAVKKEQKLYMWDWSQVPEPGARFENLVASQLLKYCHHLQDHEGYVMELRYIRDTDGREVDFVVVKDGNAEFAVEVKLSGRAELKSLCYFKERTEIPHFYQVHTGAEDFLVDGIRVLPLTTFCQELNMP
ncbi:AAA family ATPase [Chromatiales bacterium (ex Bugula neritina AB1)]|nr:AAA family ATPase [Chromatiales bacterium (ex Bugula neritina AB1)]